MPSDYRKHCSFPVVNFSRFTNENVIIFYIITFRPSYYPYTIELFFMNLWCDFYIPPFPHGELIQNREQKIFPHCFFPILSKSTF